jgi:hypothetical protein
MYRCVCDSVEGFVQQLAVGYVARGFYFYTTGNIKPSKDPAAVDAKLIDRYGIDVSKWQRARRKRAGIANLQYVRHDRFFVLLATHGDHPFFADEPFRDIREAPIKFHGYSIGCGKGYDGRWHASVRIHAAEYRSLKAYFLDLAVHRSAECLAGEFQRVPFAPFARVRRQMLNIFGPSMIGGRRRDSSRSSRGRCACGEARFDHFRYARRGLCLTAVENCSHPSDCFT